MKCPHCGSNHMRRSHVRPWEVLFKAFTRRRPHRCEDCRWRGWLVHEHHHHGEHPRIPTAEALVPSQGEPDQASIDDSLHRK